MTPLQALARAVAAGRAGKPLDPATTDALAAHLASLRAGKRERGRPEWSYGRDRNFWRVVSVVELMREGLDYKQARDRVLVGDPRTGAAPVDPGPSDSQLRKHMQRWRTEAERWLADDAADSASYPPRDPLDPDAIADFR